MSTDYSIGFIKLSHFSVKEYLISQYIQNHDVAHIRGFSFNEELSHYVISQICLAYLMQFNTPELLDTNVEQSSPLAEYAAQHWISHTHAGGRNKSKLSVGLTLMMKLLTNENAFLNWVRLCNIDRHHTMNP